ncbi:MAG: hypothetical protein JSW00_15720 [Thermoplasmata archaeon]|nr:MAG: hypothetical protein JSW00_15720 [Thermoplasmata archaeon]
MALMVFLAFFSFLILYWIPVMMEDNEESHMRDVKGQFSKLKETVDEQISLDNRDETRDTTIALGADGVPPFEKETQSQLSLQLNSEFFNYSFQDSGDDIYENSSGSIDLYALNRFYVQQRLVYENGAVLIVQSKGQIVYNEPEFHVEKHGDEVKLSSTLISLYHDSDDRITGTRPEKVSTRLWYTDRWVYTNLSDPNRVVTLTIKTRYSSAWETYYDTTFRNAGLVNGEDYNITAVSGGIRITIDRVFEFSLTHAFIEAYIGRQAK